MSVDVNMFHIRSLSGVFSLQKSVEVMCIVPKRCNDMMNVGRLQGFDVRQTLPVQHKKCIHVDLIAFLHLSKDEISFVLIVSFRGR